VGAVDQQRQVVTRDLPQQPVGEHDAQPRAGPVGGDQQEVAERRRVVQHGERDGQADYADDHGDRGTGEAGRQSDAHGRERQRARVRLTEFADSAPMTIAIRVRCPSQPGSSEA